VNWRRSDRVALAFFLTALVLLVVLQVVPFSYRLVYGAGPDPERTAFMGYEIWAEVFDELVDVTSWDMQGAVISGALVLGSLTVCLSPFLIRLIAVNRALWWFLAVSSGLVFVGLTVLFLWMLGIDPPDSRHWKSGPGLKCLIAFPAFHFLGVLWIRRDVAVHGLAPQVEDR